MNVNTKMPHIALLYFVLLWIESSFSHNTNEVSVSYAIQECNHKLQRIDSIAKFDKFIGHYKVLIQTELKPKATLFNSEKRLRRCIELKDSLLELENLVNSRHEGVCRMDYIRKIAKFHEMFINRDGTDFKLQSKPEKPYIGYFFSLFVHQVAFTCKSSIIERVRAAQLDQDCSIILTRLMPDIFLTDSSQDMADAVNFLREFKRVEFFTPIQRFSSQKDSEPYFDVKVPKEVIESVETLRSECLVRQPYYLIIFSPVSTLSQLGYIVDEPSCDSEDMSSPDTKILKCWLATAQLCQGILRTHLNPTSEPIGDEEEESEKLITVRWGALPIDATEVKETAVNLPKIMDTVDEISPAISKLVEGHYSTSGKIKQKAISLARKILMRHIDVDSLDREMSKRFIDALINSDIRDEDSEVGFAGQPINTKKYNPVSIVTENADFIVQMSSSFWGQKLGLVVSSVVAVVMSAVFVYFSLYATVTILKQRALAQTGEVTKSEWRKLRDDKMEKYAKRLNREDPGYGSYQPR